MALEIERKFLMKNESWRGLAKGKHYRQGYLNQNKDATVRVRTIGEEGYLTIKGPNENGSRLEYEYTIPIRDAIEMLEKLSASPIVEKLRHVIPYEGFIWEVDEFLGENEGLIFAEIELEHPGQQFSLPPWIGREVTDDPRFYNSNLARNPYKLWKEGL
ncbi:CYTH domain-containing protein [Desulfopila aestuarii]|uniref:CYTH domain-containing protein n=1 Tax=Desulfopila aestuarii DSM 18488 TaxID=1121416 RepID=A0A1M7XWB6_9BACT|nr:CYTH domain-containing protein [Desulfopila aestuarii]SHO43023.1 CYTH domain-containing protein [Desulfopila aestuarii DSM 18488]